MQDNGEGISFGNLPGRQLSGCSGIKGPARGARGSHAHSEPVSVYMYTMGARTLASGDMEDHTSASKFHFEGQLKPMWAHLGSQWNQETCGRSLLGPINGNCRPLAKTRGSSRVYETTVGKPTRVRRRDNEGPLGEPARVRSVSGRWSKRVCIGGVVLHHGGVILNNPPSLLAESGILPSKYRTLKH